MKNINQRKTAKTTFLKKEDFKLLKKYLDKNYRKKHIFTQSKKVFDWMYLNKKINKYNFLIKKINK